ncbi:MAG TPA: TadE/TadG family type IV pilus assembly protein [Usitatibacter sp.]|nr:TadE/TadG family type IV pilus assembly protein [Usitatibacter sp.]
MNAQFPRESRGAVLIEFALSILILLFLVLGLLELGRAFYRWNGAVDAAQRGARAAAIAAVGDTDAVLAQMRLVVPDMNRPAGTRGDAKVFHPQATIEYSIDGTEGSWSEAGCGEAQCQYVRVSVDYEFTPWLVWFLPKAMTMPTVTATSVAEALGET